MKRISTTLVLVAVVSSVVAQEKLPRELALEYAAVLTNYTKQMQATPIPTRPDLNKPVGVRYEGYGGMVLPEVKLSAETLAKAGKDVTPVGQLWMVKLSPISDGQVVPAAKLHMIHVTHGETEVDAACCALGVRKAEGNLELLIFGKGTTPLLRLPLKSISTAQENPIDVSAERVGDSGLITLKLAGKYEASFKVGDSEAN